MLLIVKARPSYIFMLCFLLRKHYFTFNFEFRRSDINKSKKYNLYEQHSMNDRTSNDVHEVDFKTFRFLWRLKCYTKGLLFIPFQTCILDKYAFIYN